MKRPGSDEFRAAIRSIDRLPVRHTSRERAEALWRAVVDGAMSVLDVHDHEGRRYIAAAPASGRGLTPREAEVAALASLGHHDKLIAHAMGISRSTVTTHLLRAIRKLGLRDRVELALVLTAPSARAAEHNTESPAGETEPAQ